MGRASLVALGQGVLKRSVAFMWLLVVLPSSLAQYGKRIEVFLREVAVTQPDQYFTETVALPAEDLFIV
eukprot:8690503-Pyramimonas_sp.AAC.1